MSLLFTPTKLAGLSLNNHLVMCPLTRCRATNNLPNELMAEYYAQRASAGLIITEGTSPSPNGVGYARMPGIYSDAQIAGWRRVSDAVHQAGGKIFMQLMHTGRMSHHFNLPEGAKIVAPSAIAAAGDMYTDAAGMQPLPTPQAMDATELAICLQEYVQAAQNAIAAGMNGVELHAANGYLLEQFIRPNSNQRSDEYGGNTENRARFVLAVVDAVSQAIGKDRVGIRFSPYGVFNDMHYTEELDADYTYLAQQLNTREIAYIHLVDHSAHGAPTVPDSIKAMFREQFNGCLILSGGYDVPSAEADLQMQRADLIGVGRLFISNPDLVARWQSGTPTQSADPNTFYTPGPRGYTDYPTANPV